MGCSVSSLATAELSCSSVNQIWCLSSKQVKLQHYGCLNFRYSSAGGMCFSRFQELVLMCSQRHIVC